jgi:hypothetical protein
LAAGTRSLARAGTFRGSRLLIEAQVPYDALALARNVADFLAFPSFSDL